MSTDDQEGIIPNPGVRIRLANDEGESCIIEIVTECDDGSYLVEIVETNVKSGPWSEAGKLVNIEVEHKP